MSLLQWVLDWWTLEVPIAAVGLGVATTLHVLLHKREPRAAVGWIGLIWLAPFVGCALYLVFGINRIQRKAMALRVDPIPSAAARALQAGPAPSSSEPDLQGLEPLARLGHQISGWPLLAGNRVALLEAGDATYPQMWHAIDSAQQSVSLLTYLFDRDAVGTRFVQALGDAVDRGVQVRVLIDALGARYSTPTILPQLRARGVTVARFLPARPWSVAFLNLRNHRKVCVVDGRVAFTGGMNLRADHLLATASPGRATRDLHARVEGPVVAQLQQVFTEDWAFATGEVLEGALWFPVLESIGDVHMRALPDGPDGQLDSARLTFLGGLNAARHTIRVVTPYFLPSEALTLGLISAALRGVVVDVVLPERSNLRYVDWATVPELSRLIERGVRIWRSPAPFDHSKLMVVDGRWVVIGSANWDPRSLRLNFELEVELYDRAVGDEAEAAVLRRLRGARRVTLEELRGRSVWVRLRDRSARLFKPYL